jgi:DNA-binding NtrC family response regulator
MNKPIRVLVVDDEELIRSTLSDYLQILNYEVVKAESGRDALNKFGAGKFDIIISDLMMPDMGGLELLEEIRQIDDEVIFLLITGYPSIESAVKAIEKGAYDYITKPFRMEELKLRINRSIEKKSLTKRLNTSRGMILALLISIPLWLILGIILASILKW